MSLAVGVAGATGAVGSELLRVLEQRRFPIAELRLFAASEEAGKRPLFRGSERPLAALAPGCFDGLDLAFFATAPAVSREWVPRARAAGALVIDNSSAFRLEPDVPLVVPEVNPSDLEGHAGLIANPNCTTALLVTALAPLCGLARPLRLLVATYQAVSGAGNAGVEELERELSAAGRGREAAGGGSGPFPERIAGNVIPAIGPCDLDGWSGEETKVRAETRKILRRPDLLVSATCVRVPVVRAHCEAVHVGFDRPVASEEARERLGRAPGVAVVDDPARGLFPTPLRAETRDEVLVGRIRADETLDHGIAFFLAGDQLRKGAALNAVQIAELALC